MKKLKVGIIVVCLAVAVTVTLVFSPTEEPIPDTDESQTQWMCRACSHVFMLTAREHAAETARGPEPSPPLYCPKCGKKEAYRAAKCSKCGTVYFGAQVPGATGACPKCYPRRSPPREEPEEDTGPARRKKRPKSA